MGWSSSNGWNNEQGWSKPAAAGGGGGGLVWTPTINPTPAGTGGATTFTFSGLTFSAGITVIFVSVALGEPITSMTIDGVSATKAVASGAAAGGDYATEIWYASTTAGTGSVVVNTTSTAFGCNIAGGVLTGATGPTGSTAVLAADDSSTFGAPITVGPVTIPAGGIALGAISGITPGFTTTWLVGTADFNTDNGANLTMSSGNITTAGSISPSWNSQQGGGIAVAVFH